MTVVLDASALLVGRADPDGLLAGLPIVYVEPDKDLAMEAGLMRPIGEAAGLSLGERMKMELIASLLHQPKVLFLDEPTIGLDVISQKTVREFLREHNAKRQTTILLTSHYMADIQELCRRVIIIDHGTIFFDGSLSEIVDRFADFKLVTIQTSQEEARPAGDLARYGEVIEQKGGCIKLKVKRDRVIAACKALLDDFPVTDIDIQDVPIEDVIRQIFAR